MAVLSAGWAIAISSAARVKLPKRPIASANCRTRRSIYLRYGNHICDVFYIWVGGAYDDLHGVEKLDSPQYTD